MHSQVTRLHRGVQAGPGACRSRARVLLRAAPRALEARASAVAAPPARYANASEPLLHASAIDSEPCDADDTCMAGGVLSSGHDFPDHFGLPPQFVAAQADDASVYRLLVARANPAFDTSAPFNVKKAAQFRDKVLRKQAPSVAHALALHCSGQPPTLPRAGEAAPVPSPQQLRTALSALSEQGHGQAGGGVQGGRRRGSRGGAGRLAGAGRQALGVTAAMAE